MENGLFFKTSICRNPLEAIGLQQRVQGEWVGTGKSLSKQSEYWMLIGV